MSHSTLAPQINAEMAITQTHRAAAQRISALDFTKGALVLIMVFYHWINYFIGPQWHYYFYMRFLTPSFIFITGFMISHVYLSKYDAADGRLPKRLLVRGLKLMAIFIVLNVARALVLPILSTSSLAKHPLARENLGAVFVTGNLSATNKLVSFSILVPIAYLLMLCALLMIPYRSYKYTFHILCAFLLLSILVLAYMGTQSNNLEFVTIGLLGALTGFMPLAAINNLVRHPFVLAFCYLCYLICITVWNVPFPLLIIGVCLNLMIIYRLGVRKDKPDQVHNMISLLGKYSLFGYISQIGILQILDAIFRHVDLRASILVITFLAAFYLTILSVQAVDRARRAAVTVDRLYKAVFA